MFCICPSGEGMINNYFLNFCLFYSVRKKFDPFKIIFARTVLCCFLKPGVSPRAIDILPFQGEKDRTIVSKSFPLWGNGKGATLLYPMPLSSSGKLHHIALFCWRQEKWYRVFSG